MVHNANSGRSQHACVRAAGAFANSSAGSPLLAPSGAWLGSPVAVLQAVVAGKPTAVLLQLSEPRYDAGKHSLTFHVRTCSPEHVCCMPCGIDSRAGTVGYVCQVFARHVHHCRFSRPCLNMCPRSAAHHGLRCRLLALVTCWGIP